MHKVAYNPGILLRAMNFRLLVAFVLGFAVGTLLTSLLAADCPLGSSSRGRHGAAITNDQPPATTTPAPEDEDILTEPKSFHEASGNQTLITHQGERAVADLLIDKVRILCWIMTTKKNHARKARHVKATWARRCNKFVFMSDEEDESLPAVKLDVENGRDWLWAKTRLAFKHVYERWIDEYDWFLKADDDTYVVVENLRLMLLPHNSHEPLVFGCRFKPYTPQGYMSGGAGYVLSKEAVKRFVREALPRETMCKSDHRGDEDIEMAKCLYKVGVKAGDSRDALGEHRFLPFPPDEMVAPRIVNPRFWFWRYTTFPLTAGPGCCSDWAVSFHYVKPEMLYVIDYFVYHLRPFGVQQTHPFHSGSPTNASIILELSRRWALEMRGAADLFLNRRGEAVTAPTI